MASVPAFVPTTYVVSGVTGPDPARVICPSCRADVVTATELRSNTKTHIYALLLCLFLCWPCVCLPYCCTSCRDTIHRCPRCKTCIGVYQR